MNERRRFLHVLTGAVAVLGANCTENTDPVAGTGGGGGSGAGGDGGSGGSGVPMPSEPVCMPTGNNMGPVDNFAANGLHQLKGWTFLIARDEGGLYAMSATCTHASCNLNSTFGTLIDGGIHCGCHGSEFDNNGAVLKGPALSPLKHHLCVVDCEGNVWVDSMVVVPSDTRFVT